MSVIRSTSNPEGLYIWGEKCGRGMRANIYHCIDRRDFPLMASTRGHFSVPWSAFRRVCEVWNTGWAEKATCNGFTAEEVWVEGGLRVRISYKQHFVCLWKTTWMYVVHDICEREW
jgi:hypothetical protein